MNIERSQKAYRRRLLWQFLEGSRALFLLSMFASTLSTLADMLSPQLIRLAVDRVLAGREGALSPLMERFAARLGGVEYLAGHIWLLSLALLAVALLKVLSLYAYRVCNARAAERLTKTMRDRLFLHLSRLPYAWHMRHHTGDIIQRCTSDIGTLKQFLSEQLSSLLRVVLLIALAFAFMLGMNPRLTLVAMLPVPLIIVYSLYYHRKIGEAFLDCDENEGLLSTMAQENLTGVRVVRAFGQERRERARFFAHNDYYTGLWLKLARPMSRFWCTGDVISGVQIMLVVTFGSVLCIRGELLPGEFLAFLSYAAMLTWPVRMLGRTIAEMSKAGVSIDRIADIMQAEEETESGKALRPDMNAEIAFEHVSFAYGDAPEVLHDISFTVPAGTTLGILGGTGSGKSTLMLLLDRLYELPEGGGRITVGGVDIRDIETRWLREHIGMVLQEPYLFSRTIAENIGITQAEPDMARIREAARAACLDETVQDFAKGYDTFVGERGVTLSGGQKQRAAIARALTQDAPILIFDDSLSAVDTETDAKIRAALEARFGSATIVLISHRITTLSKADQILVLEGGRIAERGTHDELKNAGGLYAEICRIQSGEEAIA